MSRTITSVKSLLNMMDVVLQQFYMGAGSNDAYAQWSQPMFGCVEVSNFKAFDPDIALVLDREYGASSWGSEMLCVQDSRFSGIASKSNVSVSRVAGSLDA